MKKKKLKTRLGLDQYDCLSEKAVQLEALLLTISGGGFASFSELTEPHQDNMLWLAARLSSEITQLIHE